MTRAKDSANNERFSNALITWYLENKRDLPWRRTKDPFKIWLSEIILQQTRVDQGLEYYHKFTEEFEDVFALASAEEDEVLRLWQGLGYYSRGRNLLQAAKTVVSEYAGSFPSNYKTLKTLKGVGDYTAAAISSIAFNEAQAVVDGNVYRVLARYFSIDLPINQSQGIKTFRALAQELLDQKDPGTYNQALMELGALICTPKKPDCEHCPIQESCLSKDNLAWQKLPVKLKKTERRRRFLNFLVLQNQAGEVLFQRRDQNDIWRGLYCFPLIETKDLCLDQAFLKAEVKAMFAELGEVELKPLEQAGHKHLLTHQELHCRFWLIKADISSEAFFLPEETKSLGLPVPIRRFVDKNEAFPDLRLSNL